MRQGEAADKAHRRLDPICPPRKVLNGQHTTPAGLPIADTGEDFAAWTSWLEVVRGFMSGAIRVSRAVGFK